MKRSEVIEHLTNLLDGVMFHDREIAVSEAAHILAELESMGMKPPSIKEPCETWVMFNGRHVKAEDSFVFTHKWDEE